MAARRGPRPAPLVASRALRIGVQVGVVPPTPVAEPLVVEVPETSRHPIEGRVAAPVGPRDAVALVPTTVRTRRVAGATEEVQGTSVMAGL